MRKKDATIYVSWFTIAMLFVFVISTRSIYLGWVEKLEIGEDRCYVVLVMMAFAFFAGGLSLALFQLVEFIWGDNDQ
jgi:hypothetical protein